MSDENGIVKLGRDPRLATLADKFHEVISEYGEGVPYASVIGVLEVVQHELTREALDDE